MKKYLLLLCIPAMLITSEQNSFSEVKKLLEEKKWSKLIDAGTKMEVKYSKSLFIKEVYFFLGKAYFHAGDPDLANQYLTKFLETDGGSIYFEEAVKYKYFIAEKFEQGYYGHLFGASLLPRLEPMWEIAYELYDEVIYTIPRHEVAAKSLFNKSRMLAYDQSFDDSIECLTNLIRRFPQQLISQEAYIQIAKNYRLKVMNEFLDTRCYEFVLINQTKFTSQYPSSSLHPQMEKEVQEIADLFAEDIYKSALYFDKKENIDSAVMYFESLIAKYPKSKFALKASNRLAKYEEKKQLLELNDNAILLIGGQ